MFDENFSKADILNEALNQARVEETGLHIPSLNEVTTVDGKWVISTKFIAGKTLAQMMDESPEKEDEYLGLFVDLQLKMHDQKVPLLNKLKDKMNRKISESDFDATTRYELHTRLEGMPKHTKLCHGDFKPQQYHRDRGRYAVYHRLVPCNAGQCQCRCGTHLSAVLPVRQKRAGREVPEPLLQKE